MTENEIGRIIVDSAITVHKELGPGLLESVYEVVLAAELRQMPISIHYKDLTFAEAFRADIVVDKKVIVELKSVEQISEAHKKQGQAYLRLTGCKLGFLLNFGETRHHPRREPRTTPSRAWLRGNTLRDTRDAFLPAVTGGASCVVRGEWVEGRLSRGT